MSIHPRDALERVVYLLDRSLADGNKVRAYQRAIDIVDEVGDDELATLHDRGALTELPGIGKSTGAVIAQALDGSVPKKIVELEAATVIEPSEGTGIREALKGDCHLHSVWSDGGATIETMAETARSLGHEYMVLTDHSPRLTVAHGLNADRLRTQLDEIRALHFEMLAAFTRRDLPAYYRLNAHIHNSINAAARNPVLAQTYRTVNARLQALRFRSNFDERKWGIAVQEHEQMVEKLAARDGAGLRALLVQHLENKRDAVLDLMQQGQLQAKA